MLWSCVFVGLLAVGSTLNLPGVPSAFTENDEIISAISDDIATKFADEYIAYQKTGIESATLRQISKQLAAAHSKKDIFIKSTGELSSADQFVMCTTCRAIVRVIGRTFRGTDGELNGPNAEEDSRKVMLYACDRFNLQTQEVCSGLFELNWPFVQHIIHNTVAEARSLCGSLPISFCSVKQEEFNWSLSIDASGPAVEGPKKDVPKKSDKDLAILQITDIHYDPEYTPGSLADCDEPMCCQQTPSGGVEASKQAGYWSDYRDCDSPLHMIEDAFDHMKQTHQKIDYIYQTGDIVPHIVWKTTKEGNLQMLTKINDLIEERFPGIPVYPSVGNHESHPSNVFSDTDAPEDMNVQWLYEHLYSVWSKWLPADTKETILKGGYYTVAPKPGFRIISLNNNDCYLFNWWVHKDGRLGMEQLQWLHDVLLAAEKAGEYVHILVHIPSGDSDCWTVWAREYNRLIERFNHIISGIFNGHTHVDEINVHYSAKGDAVGVSWNGGSLTTFSNKNPNYVLYEVEPEKMQVVDYETWIYDLVEANAQGADVKPKWFKEYQFSEFTEDLSPAGVDALLDKMAENPSLLKKYWTYKGTSAEPRVTEGCDDKCLLKTICRLATTVYDQTSRCKELQQKLKANLPDEQTPTDTPSTDSPTTKDPNGDGAASIAAMKITSLIILFYMLKLLY